MGSLFWVDCSKTEELELDLNEEAGNYISQVREEIYNLDSGILQNKVGFQIKERRKESILSTFFGICAAILHCALLFFSLKISRIFVLP